MWIEHGGGGPRSWSSRVSLCLRERRVAAIFSPFPRPPPRPGGPRQILVGDTAGAESLRREQQGGWRRTIRARRGLVRCDGMMTSGGVCSRPAGSRILLSSGLFLVPLFFSNPARSPNTHDQGRSAVRRVHGRVHVGGVWMRTCSASVLYLSLTLFPFASFGVTASSSEACRCSASRSVRLMPRAHFNWKSKMT